MRKTILSAILCIIILGMMSCNDEIKDNDVRPFSYDEYLDYLERSGEFQVDPSRFKNTTETKVKTKERAIELAKNEITQEYNQIDVRYDESNSMWWICFYYEHPDKQYLVLHSGEHIFMNSKGITKIINYEDGPPFVGDSDILKMYYEGYIASLENTGGKLVDPGRFKNTTETEVKIKEDIIELAKNEIDQTKEYDKITVYYDEVDSMWAVAFWLYDKYHMGQYVFIDSKGITKLVMYGE